MIVVGVIGDRPLEQLRVAIRRTMSIVSVERNPPARPGRLRRPEADAVAGRDELLVDVQASGFEVESAPSDSGELAPSHAGGPGQPPERVQDAIRTKARDEMLNILTSVDQQLERRETRELRRAADRLQLTVALGYDPWEL